MGCCLKAVGADIVPAPAFRLIEELVNPADQFPFLPLPAAADGEETAAESYGQCGPRNCEGVAATPFMDAVGDLHRFPGAGIGHQGHELVAPVATHKIQVAPDMFPEDRRYLLQGLIAAFMTVGVVDALEMVDVRHQDGKDASVPPDPRQFFPEADFKDISYVKARQAVPGRHLEQHRIFQGNGDHRRQDVEKLQFLRWPRPSARHHDGDHADHFGRRSDQGQAQAPAFPLLSLSRRHGGVESLPVRENGEFPVDDYLLQRRFRQGDFLVDGLIASIFE